MKIREITYDPRAKAGYLYFNDKPIAKTVQHSGFINLDLDRKGGLVGIELMWIEAGRFTDQVRGALNHLAQKCRMSELRWLRPEKLSQILPPT